MANTARGEVDLMIAGRAYPIAMTLDAIARIADQFGVETLAEVEQRMIAFKVADWPAVMRILLVANGHQVGDDQIARLPYRAVLQAIVGLWNAKPDADAPADEKAAASPQKRAG